MMTTNEEVIVNERSRKYVWDSDSWAVWTDVEGVRVSASGTHYVRQKNGNLHIVAPGWRYIGIEPKTPETGWTF
jgi:hypothetical protein